MKPNLKTLKKMYETVVRSATIPNILTLGKELNDFEAEIRKEIESIESYKGTNVHIWYEETYLVLKKLNDILGEKP